MMTVLAKNHGTCRTDSFGFGFGEDDEDDEDDDDEDDDEDDDYMLLWQARL
jgi:regulator of RNase E activity RraB